MFLASSASASIAARIAAKPVGADDDAVVAVGAVVSLLSGSITVDIGFSLCPSARSLKISLSLLFSLKLTPLLLLLLLLLLVSFVGGELLARDGGPLVELRAGLLLLLNILRTPCITRELIVRAATELVSDLTLVLDTGRSSLVASVVDGSILLVVVVLAAS